MQASILKKLIDQGSTVKLVIELTNGTAELVIPKNYTCSDMSLISEYADYLRKGAEDYI